MQEKNSQLDLILILNKKLVKWLEVVDNSKV